MADATALTQRAVLFGARGMIGSALAQSFAGPNLEAFSHQDLDITDYAAVEKIFRKIKPNLILNAAAFTRVDDCEKFREAAFLVNAQAPGQIAGLCQKHGALFIHLSTDYIFDGNQEVPYKEEDIPNPINYYGTTKWEAEKRIVSSGCSFLMLRTSWVFGRNGDNFVKKILKRALAGARLQVPLDQTGSPTHAGDVALAIVKLLAIGARNVIHFSSSGQCSRFDQARTILQLYGLNNSLEAAKNEGLHLLAKRPRFSVLDVSHYTSLSGHIPRSWQQSTAAYIAYLKQNEQELRS